MTYTAHDPRLLYDALVARLASQTGRPIGDNEAPSNPDEPYAFVSSLVDEPTEGPINNPTQVVDDVFQVTSVSATRQQAQWMQQKARAALLGWTPTVTGVGTYPIQLLLGGGVTQDFTVQPPVFMAVDRFTARLSS